MITLEEFVDEFLREYLKGLNKTPPLKKKTQLWGASGGTLKVILKKNAFKISGGIAENFEGVLRKKSRTASDGLSIQKSLKYGEIYAKEKQKSRRNSLKNHWRNFK